MTPFWTCFVLYWWDSFNWNSILLYLQLLLSNPRPRNTVGICQNPTEHRTPAVLQARESTLTIPAPSQVLPDSCFNVTNGSLSALVISVDFIRSLGSYQTVWMAVLEKTKKDLLGESTRGNSIVLWLFLWKRQKSYLCSVRVGRQTLSVFIHILTHCVDHQLGLQSLGLHTVGHDWSDLACTHANKHFSIGVTFKPCIILYYIFVKETLTWVLKPRGERNYF